MSLNIPFSKVDCSGNEWTYVKEVLNSGWLTTAGKTKEFERRFAEAVGAKFARAVTSGTAALHLALEALGVGPGDEVLVQTMTFTATAEVVRYLSADPVFLDVEYGTSLVSPEILKEGIEKHPKGKVFIPVHYGGQAAPLILKKGKGLLDICNEKGLRIVEDAAHAFPARCADRMIGNIGDVTCFSFYANKTITTGEGGMLTTNDDSVAERVKVMRLHGINRDIWDRYTSAGSSWEYDVIAPGFKYNMPDTAAAIGLAQLERADLLRQERERCAKFYFNNLADIDSIDLPKLRESISDHAWHLFSIVLNDRSQVTRNRVIELMAEKGIGTSVHYKPLHRMTYYRERYGLRPEDFPNAERIWKGCVSLPIYPTLKNEDLEYICTAIRNILD
jgi:dTDP-4-amino-4,6-dideoxygalactose transaminase